MSVSACAEEITLNVYDALPYLQRGQLTNVYSSGTTFSNYFNDTATNRISYGGYNVRSIPVYPNANLHIDFSSSKAIFPWIWALNDSAWDLMLDKSKITTGITNFYDSFSSGNRDVIIPSDCVGIWLTSGSNSISNLSISDVSKYTLTYTADVDYTFSSYFNSVGALVSSFSFTGLPVVTSDFPYYIRATIYTDGSYFTYYNSASFDGSSISFSIPNLGNYSSLEVVYQLICDSYVTDFSHTFTSGSTPSYNPQVTAFEYSVSSSSFISQVGLNGLNPAHVYKLHYGLYSYDENGDEFLVSSGFPPEFGEISGVGFFTGYHQLSDLTPNTDYLIQWLATDITDNTIVPSVANVEFTTLDDGSGGSGSGSSDDNSGILLMILNKVSAILDTLNGGQSEGILASINEKLNALIDTLANPEEQQLEENFKGSLTEVNNNFFGDDAKGQAVTVSDVGNLADTQSTVKTIFQSDYTVTDFFALFSDNSFFGWFSAETAMDLNPISYGGVSAADMDDPYNMQAYYDNLEKVRGKK